MNMIIKKKINLQVHTCSVGSVAKIASIIHLILLCLSFAPVLLLSVCKLILLHQSYIVTPVEQHKMHMLINMEQHLLLMLHAWQDIHALDGALGLYKD